MSQAPPNEYFVNEPITLSCLFLTGETVGLMEKNQSTVYVRDLSKLTLTPGSPIVVIGAGYVGGDLRTTVVSDDDIGAIVVGASAKTRVDRAIVGSPTDPSSVTCKVRKPDGTLVTVTATSSVVGLWEGVYTPDVDGAFYYRFTGVGNADGDGWRKFTVSPERV